MNRTNYIFPILFITIGLIAVNSCTQKSDQHETENMTQTDQNKYGLSGKFTAKAGKADELVSILLEAAELVSAAKGCQLYIVSRDTQNENDIWITEVWDSKEDHDNSLQLDGVRKLISKALPLIEDQPRQGLELEVIGGAGIGN